MAISRKEFERGYTFTAEEIKAFVLDFFKENPERAYSAHDIAYMPTRISAVVKAPEALLVILEQLLAEGQLESRVAVGRRHFAIKLLRKE